jgi:hypothetical protein
LWLALLGQRCVAIFLGMLTLDHMGRRLIHMHRRLFLMIAHRVRNGALAAALLTGVYMPALGSPPQVAHESLSLKERAAVRKGIDNVRNQRSLLFVFSPGPYGPFCDQAAVLSRSAQQLREHNIGIVWLFFHDAIGMSSSTGMCAAPTTRSDVSVRQMKIKGAGFNDGGISMLYRYSRSIPEHLPFWFRIRMVA